jgi:5-methylcytosine-specific restriction endonuclease McrA
MPIKREIYHLYPGGSPRSKEWKAIGVRIRTRAGHCCEGCGVVNNAPFPNTGKPVVLTIAHLNHNPANSNGDNLRAWCQKCHLGYDREHHQANAARTRAARRAAPDARS